MWQAHGGRREARDLQTITPYLLYRDVAAALGWLERAFGFREVLRVTDDDGTVTHAEARLDGAAVFLGDPRGDYRPPEEAGVTVGIHVYVDEVDAHFERARAAGAEILSEPHEPGYGDRRYDCVDLEGHQWYFAEHLREVPPEEWGATPAA